jgi:hypothetical protein
VLDKIYGGKRRVWVKGTQRIDCLSREQYRPSPVHSGPDRRDSAGLMCRGWYGPVDRELKLIARLNADSSNSMLKLDDEFAASVTKPTQLHDKLCRLWGTPQ